MNAVWRLKREFKWSLQRSTLGLLLHPETNLGNLPPPHTFTFNYSNLKRGELMSLASWWEAVVCVDKNHLSSRVTTRWVQPSLEKCIRRSFAGGDTERLRSYRSVVQDVHRYYTTKQCDATNQNKPHVSVRCVIVMILVFMFSYFLFYCETVCLPPHSTCTSSPFVSLFRVLRSFGPVLSPMSPRRMFLFFVPRIVIDLSFCLSSVSPGFLFLGYSLSVCLKGQCVTI